MKGIFLLVLCMIILSSQVFAVTNVELFEFVNGEEFQVENVRGLSSTDLDREVILRFVTSDFISATLNANNLLSGGNSQNNIEISIDDCEEIDISEEVDNLLACEINDLILDTYEENIELYFSFVRANVRYDEVGVINLVRESNPPRIEEININNCDETCFVGGSNNAAQVFYQDDSGVSVSGMPLKVANNPNIFPFECSEGLCKYNLGAIQCIEGSTVLIQMPSSASDRLGNQLGSPKTIQAICDNSPPEIVSEPEILYPGSLRILYQGVNMLFHAEVRDSTPVIMKVDMRHLDGGVDEFECIRGNEGKWICDGEMYSPPGYQLGNAIITFIDAPNNEITSNVEVEILELDTESTPEATITNIQHKGSISRMLMAVAGERGDFEITYPVTFNINPKLYYEELGAYLNAEILTSEISHCSSGSAIEMPTISASDSKFNRIDFVLNNGYVNDNGFALINCTLNIWVKTGTRNDAKFYDVPASVDLVFEINFGGTDYNTPGEQVIKKLDEDRKKADDFYKTVENLNNFIPDLQSLCTFSDMIDKGQQLGAAVEIIGLAVSPVDGGSTLRAGKYLADNSLKIGGALATYSEDKKSKIKIDRQAAQQIQNLDDNITEVSSDALSKAYGMFKDACKYITCQDADSDAKGKTMADDSLANSQGFIELFNDSWNQLKKPNPSDNLIYAIEQKCAPAIISNLNELGQVHCSATLCMKQMAMHGGDISSCEQIEAEGTCKKILGVATESIAYLLSKEEGDAGTVGNIALAVKNFRERAATLAINFGLSAVNKQLIERVTGNCLAVEDENALSDTKMYGCHLPYALRLYIKAQEQSQLAQEIRVPTQNLCEIATCEGNSCADVIPYIKTTESFDQFVFDESKTYSAQEIELARIAREYDNVPSDWGGLGVNPYTFFGSNNGRSIHINSDYKLSDEDRVAFEKFANGYIPRSPEQYGYQIQNPGNSNEFASLENPLANIPYPFGINDFTDTNYQGPTSSITEEDEEWMKYKQYQNFFTTGVLVNYKDGVNPNELAPAGNLDPAFAVDGLERDYLMDKDGNVYTLDDNGEMVKTWNPSNPGQTYDWYRQVGARFVNKWLEQTMFAKWKRTLNEIFNEYDPYTNFENAICSAVADLPPADERAIFEPTANGIKQFDFNAEKWMNPDGQWYYTLIYFLGGFDDQEEGYDVTIDIRRSGETVRLRSFKLMPEDIHRPDSRDPFFKSVRAFTLEDEYNQICFSFSPGIPNKEDVFCKELKPDAWSGLGDPHNPNNSIPSGRTLDSSSGGWDK